MKKWMKFAVKYCRFCEIKRLKKNEKMKNAKKDFLVLLIEIRIRRKMCFAGFATFCGVKKWIYVA